MNIREQELKYIANEFATWQTRLSFLGSLNLNDANIFAEFTVQQLLNEIFGYNLKNANAVKPNYPAVDLIDNKNRIAFQVTSDASSKKIQHSINSFIQNELYNKYDELFVLILGKRQQRYNALKLPNEITFDIDRHIIDLKMILRQISFLPTEKISRIKKMFLKEAAIKLDRAPLPGNRIQRNLNMKRKLQKDFLIEINKENREYSFYEPWIKFKYRNVILRDAADKLYPEFNETNSNWQRAEFWDFYDRGIEFINQGGEAIFDKNGNWDILDYRGDDRSSNPDYEVKQFFVYPRLAFDDIEAYDMEVEDYYALPTIYCTFKNGDPFEEIMFGAPGVFNQKSWRQLFDNAKRKKAGW